MLSLSPDELAAFSLSLRVACCCTLLCLVPGIALGWLLAKKEFRGKALLDALVYLPMVLPPVVPGYLLLLVFGAHGPLGHVLATYLGVAFAFDWKGAVLASAVMGFPLLVQAVRLAMQLVDRRLEGAARTLGASPWRVFLTITLPLALPGVLAGAILCFSRSLGEFGATITFVGNIAGETRTLPLAIYTSINTPGGDTPALRLLLLSLGIAFVSLLASNLLARRTARRLGQGQHAGT